MTQLAVESHFRKKQVFEEFFLFKIIFVDVGLGANWRDSS
jgi:hypothetical protein